MKISLSSRFKRSFKKLPFYIQNDFDEKIKIFINNSFSSMLHNHKLSGNLGDYHAFYLRDGYRVLFDFNKDIIILVNVGNHDSYKKWSGK
ncbi:type II toxin-antitoxin system mRNA interferase toxin, RelE/StbE family [Candidatus Azambacteria bacterium]|nr:type II toxin-antitoxin system mRNA interferase toxin, RelE/StbE family [Candidatus Azambacteria bacterium]